MCESTCSLANTSPFAVKVPNDMSSVLDTTAESSSSTPVATPLYMQVDSPCSEKKSCLEYTGFRLMDTPRERPA